MPRPILATIHSHAIIHNLAQVRKLTEKTKARIWVVIKANAYGHGIANIYPAISEHADGFAMLDFADAALVRQLGWKKPILMLEGCFCAEDFLTVFQHKLSVVIHNRQQIEWLTTMLATTDETHVIDVYLKLNTDMNRVGFDCAEADVVYEQLRNLPQVGKIGLMTHFANSDLPNGVDHALQLFTQHTKRIRELHPHTPLSMANSAAILTRSDTHGDWVRPGVMTYGGSPFTDKSAAQYGLQAAMTLSSELIAVRNVRKGEGIGYGSRFIAQRDMRIGVVACGYADGYPRHAADGTPIMVDGVRTQLVGRVSMDMLTVDLSPIPTAQVGSSVELWGQNVPIDEVARASGTIGYELMCALATRVTVRVEA